MRTVQLLRWFAAAALALRFMAAPTAAWSQGLTASVSGQELGKAERLTAYGDNYAVWRGMRNNGWAGNDEQALRARVSFKYTFCGPQFRTTDKAVAAAAPAASQPPPEDKSKDTLCPTRGTWADAEIYFGYTAEFDFYAGTRPSGPVIGRINAPGLFVRLPASRFLGAGWGEADGLELGVQHRSDGQTTEVTGARDAEIARARYAAGDYRYFDTVSRGANFFVIAVDKALPPPVLGEALQVRGKLRTYLGTQDSEVTWGPRAGTGSKFSDYDRLELHAWWRLAKGHQLDATWRLGDRGLAADSWTLGWEFPFLGAPIYLRWHRGPMNTLSNYTQRQDSIGAGVRFAGF